MWKRYFSLPHLLEQNLLGCASPRLCVPCVHDSCGCVGVGRQMSPLARRNGHGDWLINPRGQTITITSRFYCFRQVVHRTVHQSLFLTRWWRLTNTVRMVGGVTSWFWLEVRKHNRPVSFFRLDFLPRLVVMASLVVRCHQNHYFFASCSMRCFYNLIRTV